VLPAGFPCSRAELSEDIKQLYQTGLFESVNARVLPQKKGNKFKVRAGLGWGGARAGAQLEQVWVGGWVGLGLEGSRRPCV
jgi:hypothetical protein